MQKSTQQKMFGKKYNRLAIVLSVLLLLAIIFILLPFKSFIFGSHRRYTEDVVEVYQDYWKYSLGDYTFNRTDEHRDELYNSTVDWYNYIFAFTDVNDNPRKVSINNLYWEPGIATSNGLNNQLIAQANTFIKEDIIELFNKQDILNTGDIKAASTWIGCSVLQINKNITPSSTDNGLKFNTLDLSTLAENNLNLRIHVYVDLIGKLIDFPNVKQELINATNIIFENHDYSNIEIRFTIRPSDLNGSNSYTNYYLTYDGLSYHWSDNTIFATN